MATRIKNRMIEIDPSLAPFKKDLDLRIELFERKRKELILLENPLWARYYAKWVNSDNPQDSPKRYV